MAVTPAYYKDGVPYDASGQVIITITGDKPPTPLVTDLGDGKFQFKSKSKFCYLKTINPLGIEWVMDRADGNGVAACFATDTEKQVAISLLSGFMPAPAYTQEQFQAAMLLLGAPGAMALGAGQWGMLLSVAGEGVMTLAGETAGLLESVVSRAAALLTTSIAGPAVAAASTLLFSPAAGAGSDRVPGRDLEALFALNTKLLTGKTAKISPGSASLDLPVRGSLVYSNGQLALALLKTGGEVPAAVPVLSAVRDAMTGLDIITVPAMAGAPPRTILVNPVPAPATPVNTGNTGTVPVTPVHTGTDVVPVGNIVVTPPSGDPGGLRDFIYWRPDAKGTGVEPIYVMISKSRQGVKEKGHEYHPAPEAEDIKGLGEFKAVVGKTPKQGGAGRRNRWKGDKGRKIYEWDSQHGELEGYRASDGSHLGAFDPKTGQQLKPADPKRNIKKYL